MWVLLLVFVFIPALLVCISILSLLLYIALYRATATTNRSSLGRSAAVVVLGDIGRSPRMCYHIESLADQGWRVSVIGYGGSKLPPSIDQRSSVKVHHLTQLPAWIAKLPRVAFVAVAPLKLLWQSVGLFWKVTMSVQPPPEVILVQTPPALPTLLVIRLCSLLLSTRVIIDWHNLAYSILALRLGQKSPLVSLARWLERYTGRRAFAHLFVTHAMKRHLETEWKLVGHKEVLHDRPHKQFGKASLGDTHLLWSKLAPRIQPPLDEWWSRDGIDDGSATPFTEVNRSDGQVDLRADRPALVVSSTSWTADEDFSLLLRAAQLYERRARELNAAPASDGTPTAMRRSSTQPTLSLSSSSSSFEDNSSPSRPTGEHRHANSLGVSPPRCSSPTSDTQSSRPPSPMMGKTSHRNRRPSFSSKRPLPNLPARRLPKMLIIVTGKGELRAHYEREIARLEKEEAWEYVRIRTGWLETWEYPLLLGSADLGVSLHTSSSGLDLPMKVVDMLGCHLPVLALDFPCLGELIHHGLNGLRFTDETELCSAWESLLGGHPGQGDNWLVRNGGLLDPFADVGEEDTDSYFFQSSGSSSAEQALLGRTSLEANAGLDSTEGAKKNNRSSIEFSKGGLPTSNNFSSSSLKDLASSSPLWGSAGLHPDGDESGTSMATAIPMTPQPTFTMIASPFMGPSNGFPGPDQTAMMRKRRGEGSNGWNANWKARVRPLLRLADEEDARAEGSCLSDEEEEAREEQRGLLAMGSSTETGLATVESLLADTAIGGASADDGLTLSPTMSTHSFRSYPNSPDGAGKRRSRRVGLDGKPLRVRGGSVHGLLWGGEEGGQPGTITPPEEEEPSSGGSKSRRDQTIASPLGLFGSISGLVNVSTMTSPARVRRREDQLKRATPPNSVETRASRGNDSPQEFDASPRGHSSSFSVAGRFPASLSSSSPRSSSPLGPSSLHLHNDGSPSKAISTAARRRRGAAGATKQNVGLFPVDQDEEEDDEGDRLAYSSSPRFDDSMATVRKASSGLGLSGDLTESSSRRPVAAQAAGSSEKRKSNVPDIWISEG